MSPGDSQTTPHSAQVASTAVMVSPLPFHIDMPPSTGSTTPVT
jgi:hypothetical protein